MDIGNTNLLKITLLYIKRLLSFCRIDSPPPQQERDRPRKGQLDDEVALAPHNLPPLELWCLIRI